MVEKAKVAKYVAPVPVTTDMGPAIIRGLLSPHQIFDVKEKVKRVDTDPDVKHGKRTSILADLELN